MALKILQNFAKFNIIGSVWKSSLKTRKRPQLDRTGPEKDRTSGPVFWNLRIKDRKKTGLDEPVFAVKTGLNRWNCSPNLPLSNDPKIIENG